MSKSDMAVPTFVVEIFEQLIKENALRITNNDMSVKQVSYVYLQDARNMLMDHVRNINTPFFFRGIMVKEQWFVDIIRVFETLGWHVQFVRWTTIYTKTDPLSYYIFSKIL